METHAHRLIDCLRKRRFLYLDAAEGEPDQAKYAISLAPQLERLPLMVIRDYADADTFPNDLLEIAYEKSLRGELSLPYDDFLMQFKLKPGVDAALGRKDVHDEIWIIRVRTGAHLKGCQWAGLVTVDGASESDIFVEIFETDVSELDCWLVYPLIGRIEGNRFMIYRLAMDPGNGWVGTENEAGAGCDLQDAMAFLLCSMLMLESPAVELEHVKIPKEVNRGRSLVKKSRVRDYTVLTLPRVVYASTKGVGQGGSHRSPRMHWRRSHTRHLASGKEVRIPLMLVAAKPDQPVPPPPTVEIAMRK